MNSELTLREIFLRSAVTFLAGAVSSPISTVLFEIPEWKTVGVAAVISFCTLVGYLVKFVLQP